MRGTAGGFRLGAHSLSKQREGRWNQKSLTPGELQADANGVATNQPTLMILYRNDTSIKRALYQERLRYTNPPPAINSEELLNEQKMIDFFK